MPKLTDYVREGFKRRRRPWRNGEVPEWWDIAVWTALAAVIVVIVLSAAFGGGDSAGDTAQDSPVRPIESLNPYATPSSQASAGSTPSPSASATGSDPMDFSATGPVQVPQTGGGVATVPAGAHAVAVAAARAEANGDWSVIPLLGGAPPAARRTPQGKVIGDVTVANPSVTGNTSYLFSATITHGDAAKSYLVQISVERSSSGYAVRTR